VLYQTRSTADRTAVTLPATSTGRTMVALVSGQSNAGNSGETRGPLARGRPAWREVAAIRALGLNAPIYVARDALRQGSSRGGVRQRRSALVNPASGVLAGPDLDVLDSADRIDGCHFSTEGLEGAADLWLAALKAAASPRPLVSRSDVYAL